MTGIVGLATYVEMKARTLAIAKGELHPKPADPKVWATSNASYAKWISSQRRGPLKTWRDDD